MGPSGGLQLIGRFDDAWGIGQNHLEIISVDNPQNTMTRGLSLGGDNGQFLPNKGIHQCRLAHIGVSYNIYKSCFMRHRSFFFQNIVWMLRSPLVKGTTQRSYLE